MDQVISLNSDKTSSLLKNFNQHTQNLNNHRIVYRNLLIISICLLIVSVAFLYGIYGVVKEEDRNSSFKNLTYVDTGVIGGSILILFIILIYRFNKESNQQINKINKAIGDMGSAVNQAQLAQKSAEDRAKKIQSIAENMHNNFNQIKQNEYALASFRDN